MNENQTPQIILDQTAIGHLFIARKWSSFLSIVGFVIIGIMILLPLGVLLMASRFPQDELLKVTALFQVAPIVIMMLIYGFPIYYLYQFGKYSKIAIDNFESDAITIAFKYLKLHYRFMGILVVVVLVGYILAIAGFLLAFPYFSSLMHG